MSQERKPEAGKYKHNNAEHPIWIIDRRTSLICFVLQCGPKRYLTPQLLRVSFVLDRIVHLPVPSGNVSRRGKKIAEILSAEHRTRSGRRDQARNAAAKSQEAGSAKELPDQREE
jgi:hypothetical protein